ncbi:pentatricopeptide repeat-containing protein At2g28050 [Punica granatum]|uniref:Uncharacterized protein n=2 Tax=Punica granatum TaxID=22663 RepID=A0A218WLV0_PUNGR|nr:pentatricopeptide repeat-containing protein At2g28050 [Punica granatum]OWM73775.1 hypothetical protein CDL15_Pgr026879 [Punica granatum]PKI64400.1 hypothetical protein CRG98_015185 [Punica granatum]
MSKQVCLQSFLRTLRTAKKGLRPHNLSPLLCQETLELISGSPPSISSFSSSSSLTAFLSELDLPSLRRLLSDHYIPSSTCLNLFNFLLRSPPPSLSFQPDLRSHLILICRLLKATNFSEAVKLMKSVLVDQILAHPFPLIADELWSCPAKPRTVAKFFNLMLQVYSENRLFGEALMAFDYMKGNGIEINERTCTMHLLALKRCGEVRMSVDFFDRMIESGVPISVYSLTAVVDGLCRSGEIKMGRELVEEMLSRGTVRPNVVTFNVLIAACSKRWNFDELESVLRLMEEVAVGFNLKTYKFLIDGFTSSGKVGDAKRLLAEMHDKGLRVDAHLYNLIINAYSISGAAESTVSLFDEMTKRGVVKNPDTYWALISGLCRAGKMGAVRGYMREMQRKGFELEKVMLETVMEGFCRVGMVDSEFRWQRKGSVVLPSSVLKGRRGNCGNRVRKVRRKESAVG